MAPVNRQCNLCCDKPLFSRRSNLKRHARLNHGLSGEDLAIFMAGSRDDRAFCDICRKTVTKLARHQKTLAHRRKVNKANTLNMANRYPSSDSDSDFPDSGQQKKKRRVLKDSSDNEEPNEEQAKAKAKAAGEGETTPAEGCSQDSTEQESRATAEESAKTSEDSVQDESCKDKTTPAAGCSQDSTEQESHAKAKESAKTSEDSIEEEFDDDQAQAEERAKTSEEFFIEFEKFCLSDLGGIKPNSHRLYKDKIVIFEEYQISKDKRFSLGSLISMQCDKHFQDIPECSEWVEDCFHELASKEMALNAYKKLLDMLKHKVCTLERKVDPAVSTQRTGWLERRKNEAALLAKSTGAKRDKERSQKRWEKEIDTENTEDQTVPMDELKRLAAEYRGSNERKRMYSLLSSDNKKALETLTPFEIRNFVLTDMYIECGGLRPDALLNMKFNELFNAKEVEESETYAIRVGEHKTSRNGAARVMVSHATLQLAKNFAKDIRPMICGQQAQEEDAEAFVFVTKSGRRLQSMKKSFEWFIKRANSRYKIVPYDFRRLLATLGQSSDDPMVREKFPSCMNQSRTTAEKYYVSETYRQEEHAKLKGLVWGTTSDLPVREDCHKDSEIRSAINKRAKQKKAALKNLRKSKVFRRRNKCFFSPEDVEIIKATFENLTYDDGSRIANLSTQEYKSAYQKCEPFKNMVDARIKDSGKGPDYLEKAVKNSYRWHCAKKIEELKKKLTKKWRRNEEEVKKKWRRNEEEICVLAWKKEKKKIYWFA